MWSSKRMKRLWLKRRRYGSRITACKAIDSLILELEDVKLQGMPVGTTISKADTIIFESNLFILILSVLRYLFLLSFSVIGKSTVSLQLFQPVHLGP